MFQGSDEQLQEVYQNHQRTVKDKERRLTECQKELERAGWECQRLNRIRADLLVEQGAHTCSHLPVCVSAAHGLGLKIVDDLTTNPSLFLSLRYIADPVFLSFQVAFNLRLTATLKVSRTVTPRWGNCTASPKYCYMLLFGSCSFKCLSTPSSLNVVHHVGS